MKTETLRLHVMPNKISNKIFSDLKNKQINVNFFCGLRKINDVLNI